MDEKKVYENGIHLISNDDYHSSSGISRSALMEFKRSPFHYHHKYLCGDNDISQPTPAMIMGNLVHTMVLEPHKFDADYIVQPKLDRRTKSGKFEYCQFQATLSGRIPITNEQYDIALAIKESVHNNDLANSLLQDCKIEQSIYFNHEGTGIQCKVRPDAWNGSIVVDLKTTASANYRDFQNSVFKYGYDTQAAIIKLALASINISLEKFVFIAVEKEKPHAVAIYILDDIALDYGVTQFNHYMSLYYDCLKTDKWPGYGLQTLCLPSYAKYEIETEYEHE